MKSAIVVVLFGLTSFLASVLLFSVEPMIGKMVLPVFGGTPSVWNTCLVYFQMMLLCGYLLALGVDRAEEVEPRRVSMVPLLTARRASGGGLVLAADRAPGRRRPADLIERESRGCLAWESCSSRPRFRS